MSAGKLRILCNPKLIAFNVENFLEGPEEAGIKCSSPAQKGWFLQGIPLQEGRAEIPCQCKAEPIGYLVGGYTLLLEMDHVRLGKDGASACYGGPPWGGSGTAGEFLDAYPESPGLLLEKGSRSGCALIIQCK